VFHFITQAAKQFIFSILLLIAILISVTRLLFCYVDLYKSDIQVQLSTLLETPVTIGKISASMRGLHPQLVLTELNLTSVSGLSLQEIRLDFNLLNVWHKSEWMQAASVSLIGAKFTLLHQRDGRVVIEGLKSSDKQPHWLLEGNYYQLLQSDISWREEQQPQKKLLFQQVDVILKNNLPNRHHQLHLISAMPNAYADNTRLSIDFTGNPFQPETLHANFYAQLKNLHLPIALQTWLPSTLQLQNGAGTVETWGTWQQNQLSHLSGQIKGQNLTLRRADKKKWSLKKFASAFHWQQQTESWSLAVNDLQLTWKNHHPAPAHFILGSTNTAAQQFSAYIKHLDLQTLTELGQFFIPLLNKDYPDLAKLAQLRIKGQLQHSAVFIDLKQQHYAIRGQFRHLFFSIPNPALQLANVSGWFNGTQQQGTLHLETTKASFSVVNLFRNSLKISQLRGDLHWQQQPDYWQLSSPALQLNTPDARSQHQFTLRLSKTNQPAFIDLQSTFSDLNDVRQAKTYFPTGIMTKGLVDYLDNAFLAGQVSNGKLLLYGNLADFPFRQHEGVFQILFAVRNLKMNYAAGWPLFDKTDGQVMFLNDSVEITITQGMARQARLQTTKLSIPSFHDSDYLLAQGKVVTTIPAGLDFLQHTPLKLPLKAISEQIRLTGTTQVDLDLKIPLSEAVQAKVLGTAHLNKAQLDVLAINLPISQVTGDLKFTESRFYSDALQGIALQQPLTASIAQNASQTEIVAEGAVEISALQHHFSVPNQTIATGSTDYQLTLTLPFSEQPAHLQINSTLQGVRLNLPDNLAKTAQEKQLFSLDFGLGESSLLPIRLHYAQQLNAALQFNKTTKKLVSGSILLGKGEAEAATTGLKIIVNQPHFSPLAWIKGWDNPQNSPDSMDLLTEFELHTQQLQWQNTKLGAVDLNVRHFNSDWLADIHCAAIKGQMQLLNNPATENKYLITLQQLDLSALQQLDFANNTEFKVKKLPLLEVSSEKVWLRGVNLGRFVLKSQRWGTGVKFTELSLTSKHRKLNLTGDWQLKNESSLTQLAGHLSAEKFGNLLAKLDLNQDFKETRADIDLAVHWQGAPYQFSLAKLNGILDVTLSEGRILSIEPGFGRVLGVLAMAQWIKRLQLDFGDIYKEGLTFNQITGHFVLTQGKAVSNDLTVDAVPARINLAGEVNLVNKTLAQQITVLPKSSDAVPIAGLIVGNITTAVTQTLTGEYEDGYYLRSKYKVNGKWENLTVIPLYEQDGLLQKIGRGLTDFSWLNEPE